MHPADVVMPMSNEEFAVKIGIERSQLTALGEALTIADIYRKGYSVSKPFDAGRKYSLVLDREGSLLRLNVLVAHPAELSVGIARVSFRQDSFGPVEVHEPKYSGSEFDILAIVDRTLGDVYYVPSSAIDFSKRRFWVPEADRLRYKQF